ncbi:MAG: HDOD domain-containing protein [Proteobacteria bacterium]|nr:HDOD domain-containing protein [Pseudomonadota bacterium]
MKLAESVIEELWFTENDVGRAPERASQSTSVGAPRSASEEAPHSESEEASHSMAAWLAKNEGLKTFPVVAQQVLAVLANEDFTIAEVTKIIEQDPSLASSVLRMANSALFAASKSVDSINKAFVRLGVKAVRDIVYTVATMEMFSDTIGMGKEVRDHCASTAALVQYLAIDLAPKNTQGIFLCGLMHDVGKMLLIESQESVIGMSRINYQSGTRAEPHPPDTVHITERNTIGYDHAVLAGHILTNWKLPDPIPKIVAWHHQPARAYSNPEVGLMVAILRIADQIDYYLRTSPENHEENIDKLVRSADAEAAGVTADYLTEKWPNLQTARSDSLSLFGG